MTLEPDGPAFTPIATLGEFRLIDRIRRRIGPPRSSGTLLGIGDDAAVVSVPDGARLVITTDLLIEHVHFDRTYTPMRHLGYKAMTSNISDVAAMCARPNAATVSLGIPNPVSVEMIDALYQGIAEAAERYGVDVVGGDISGSHKLVVSVTLLGHANPDELAYRSGASPTDLLCVSGSLGGSYAGLRILQQNKERLLSVGAAYEPDLADHAFVIQRHLRPEARTDLVETLLSEEIRPTAMIDVSDGLASEVRHLCTESGCSARIMAKDLPIDSRTAAAAAYLDENPLDYALYGGEEYELLFTMTADSVAELRSAGADFSVIGTCMAGDDDPVIEMTDGSTTPLIAEGFRHF
jgi:thiamine-monophosphate kinase